MMLEFKQEKREKREPIVLLRTKRHSFLPFLLF